MKKVQFGNTADQVSIMALGCLPFGTKLDRDQAFAQLDYYVGLGGNFLDTSNNYSFWEQNGQGGESEAMLNRWFKERGSRDKVFLATKLGAHPTVSRKEFFDYPGNPWADLTEGLSASAIQIAVEGSLKRLGTDRIDLLYAHVDDRRADQEETIRAFDDLVRSGKVRHIGSSNFKVWRLVRAREIARSRGLATYEAAQMFQTYFQTEKGAATGMFDQMGEELFDYARSAEGSGLTLLGYTPLLWGSYTQTHKYAEEARLQHFLRPQNDERRRRLESIAAETGWTINQVIYRWLIQSDPQVIPLVSVTRMEHLKEDLAAAELELSPQQMAVLSAAV